MRAVSDSYLDAIRGSHTMKVRARVCETFQTGTDPDGTEVPVMAGDAQFDAAADIRGTLTMETDGTRMWPSAVNLLLAPYGNEVFAERGVDLGGGTTEWVSLGYFRIETPDQAEVPDGPIRIEAKDRMAGIVDARLLAPRQYAASAVYGDVVEELVTDVYPSATIEWDDATDVDTLGRQVAVEEDRHGFLADLVTSIGKIMYWDHRGVLVIRDPPSATEPVYEVNAGAGGVLVAMARKLTRAGVYNAVVASGEAGDTDTPVRGVATDDNPTSPTYYAGRFGPVPMFFSSPFITTTVQAKAAAASLLRRQLGLPYVVDFTAVPNAALEPWDPVRVRYSTREAPETHVLQTVTIPLAPENPMTATTKEQSVVLIGVS
jgi:hypothetical protein